MTSSTSRVAPADPGVDWLDRLAGPQAQAVLWDCCGSARWAGQVAAMRPYRNRVRLLGYADSVIRQMEWSEVRQALAVLPGLSELGGRDRREPALSGPWARREWQELLTCGFDDETMAQAAAERRQEYERKFGYVFLACTRGRTARQILAALETRLANEPRVERQVVRAELAAVARTRLAMLLAAPPVQAAAARPSSPQAKAPTPTRTKVQTTKAATVPATAATVPATLPAPAPIAAKPAGQPSMHPSRRRASPRPVGASVGPAPANGPASAPDFRAAPTGRGQHRLLSVKEAGGVLQDAA